MKDICYGPIAPGQFFIDGMNPLTPVISKVVGVVIEGVFMCDRYGMNENGGVWSFGVFPNDRGWQVAAVNLERMKRVSGLDARHFAEKRLRHSDASWREQYAPGREPVKIIRCRCGIGDSEPITRHAMNCFFREGS